VIASVILAAGSSRRMGESNKLLCGVRGRPMVQWPVTAALAADLGPVVVVTGHDRDAVLAHLPQDGVIAVHNPAHHTGMASSLACGLAAVSPQAQGALILLGDMPLIGPEVLKTLAHTFRSLKGEAIVIPAFGDRKGHPVLFPRGLFDELMAPPRDPRFADRGGKPVIDAHADLARVVPVQDPGILTDVDTPQDWAEVRT
jgi:molybdenum cofactor cytidylyltransferase